MQLFEQKFKQYLTEGYRFGYNLGDDNTFLGFNISDPSTSEYFPEVHDFIESIYDSYDIEDREGSNASIEGVLTPSFMRDTIGDEQTDSFLEYAGKLTEINEDIIDLIGNHTHADMTGAESMTDTEADQDVKKEAFEEFADIFGESDAEYRDYDSISISLFSNFTGNSFEPFLKLNLVDNEDGDSYEFILDSTEDSYYSDFDEKIREIKDIAANTLNVSFD